MSSPNYNTLIDAEILHARMASVDPLILDCTFYLSHPHKGRQEYLMRHIPGAFFLDIDRDLSGPVVPGVTGRHPLPDPTLLLSTLQQCGLDQGRQVIVYDQLNGMYASRAWWLLKWLGHESVAVLDGGFATWMSMHFPTDNHWPAPTKGNFTLHLQHDLIIDRQQIEQGMPNVVDSREYVRYIGEAEPIDPVAGHIKGAVCIPFHDNVRQDGTWQTQTFLKSKFESVRQSEEPPVFYCGSGVTACHNLLAYRIATGKDGRLYAGSWSEWLHYHPSVTGPDPG